MMRLTSGASRKEPQASHATGEIAMPHPGTGYGPGLSVADRSARYVMAALRRTIDIYGWAVVGIGLATIARMVLDPRSEEHTSELQSLMRTSYAVFCLKKKN